MSRPGISRAQAVLAALSTLAVLGPVLVLAGAPSRTNDLWFHLGAGRAYAAEGPWPAGDPMLHTAHADAPVQHEWAFGLAVHTVQGVGGFAGLRAVHVAAALGAALLAFACFRRAGGSRTIAFAGTTGFLALAWWRLIQLRPDLVSIPATLAIYLLLLADDAAPSRRRIAAAAAIALAWANFHSLFAIGPALVVAGLLALALRGLLGNGSPPADRARARSLAIALAAMGIAALFNPRGIGQHLTFFTSSRDTAIWAIADEWQHFDPFHWPELGPVLSPLAWGIVNAALVASLVLAAVRLARCWRASPAERPAAIEQLDAIHLGLAAAGAVALLTSVRFAWLGIFPLLFLARALPASSERVASFAAGLGLVIALAVPSPGALAERWRQLPPPDRYFEWPFDARIVPAPAVRFLIDSGVRGNAFNRYTHGGFLGYWLAPQIRTFVDGRTEHYPPDVLDDYFSIAHQLEARPGESALEALDRRAVDLYIGVGFPIEGERIYTTARLDGAAGWLQISRSVEHAIYLRNNERNRTNVDRVATYYAAAGVPFDRSRGFDPLRAARVRPDWASEHGVVPPDYSQLVRERRDADPRMAARATERLGVLLYLLGAYPAQIDVDLEALALRPDAIEPRRRLVLSLLRLGRDGEAALQVTRIAETTGGLPPTTELARLVREVEQLRVAPGPRPPEAAINAVPALSRAALTRFFAAGPPRAPELPRGGRR